MSSAGNTKFSWPDNKRFAFSIFDDTDRATLENNQPIYRLLSELGFRTTKSVWIEEGDDPPYIPGITCADPDYLDWCLDLQKEGFEIAWHNATWETSDRERTLRGLDRFRSLFGHDPISMANHASNKEGIYWGSERLSGWRRAISRVAGPSTNFTGHVESSPLFWGDLCRDRVRYVRNFVFREIDTLRNCPWMPYHDPKKPFVHRWYASSSGTDAAEFVHLLRPGNLDRLEKSEGACIVYTHFGKGFVEKGEVIRPVRERLEDLSQRGGWFVPVSKLLDFLESTRDGSPDLSSAQRNRLELGWICDRIRAKFSNLGGE